MKCYFDKESVNLDHIEEIKLVRPLDRIIHRFSYGNFDFEISKNYSSPGLYVIEVSKHVTHWCGPCPRVPNSLCILYEIPDHVIKAAREKKIRILIMAVIEGDDYVNDYFDGYYYLQKAMHDLKLPSHSILIISGNLNANKQYKKWCEKNQQEHMIEFFEGIEWDGKEVGWEIPKSPLIYNAIKNKNSKNFNSLNRAHRKHRTEHLVYLAKNNLLDCGLVSGGFWFNKNNIDPFLHDLIFSNFPRTVDLSIDDLRVINKINPGQYSNFKIYEESLLTIVTESSFYESEGLFITEKTLRPLALGHPFLIIGQPFLLDKLNQLGFKTDYFEEYDKCLDNNLRLELVHKHLLNWNQLTSRQRLDKILSWSESIEHNFNHYKNINFKKIMFNAVIKSTKEYFLKN